MRGLHEAYVKEDRFRITGAYGQAQLHSDLYGVSNSAGNMGAALPVYFFY